MQHTMQHILHHTVRYTLQHTGIQVVGPELTNTLKHTLQHTLQHILHHTVRYIQEYRQWDQNLKIMCGGTRMMLCRVIYLFIYEYV